MTSNKEALQCFINEMDYTLKDKIKQNREYAPQVFYKNKYTLENIVKDLEKLKKTFKVIRKKDICPTKLYGARDYKTYLWVCEQEQIDKEWILTQEEYNLLNEVFENE